MDAERKSRKRLLTAEEAELWTFAMREAKALRRKERARDAAAAAEGHTQQNSAATSNGTGAQRPTPSNGRRLPPQPRPPGAAAGKTPPPLARFDERQRRRLARDAEPIDARLDLHGMRQREAHSVLRRFLLACAARGDRHVLVITGKGTRAELENGRDYLAEDRGVLRRLVPQWLGEAELRGLVVSYTEAGTRHGGGGALYLRLRKGRGAF
ncbi:MAG TPA: Smr/MutS family protein [Hyphomicrobiales bacterium]